MNSPLPFIISIFWVVTVLRNPVTIILVFWKISWILISRIRESGIILWIIFSGYAVKSWVISVPVAILYVLLNVFPEIEKTNYMILRFFFKWSQVRLIHQRKCKSKVSYRYGRPLTNLTLSAACSSWGTLYLSGSENGSFVESFRPLFNCADRLVVTGGLLSGWFITRPRLL